MFGKYILILVAAFAVFMVGCISIGSEQQQLCSDGKTIVSKLSDCPVVDTEYLECQDASSTVSGYSSVSDRDVCFYNLALDRDNVTLCKKVRATDSYSDYTASKCAAQVALMNNNPESCDLVGSIAVSDCYSELSILTEDPNMCSYIKSSTKKDDCLYSYISSNYYYITDWSICDKFSSESSDKDYCNYQAGSQTGNIVYCNKMSSSGYYSYETKSYCYGKVAKTNGDPSLCNQLTVQTDKDDCFYSYATASPYDMDVCKNINNSYRQKSCISYTNYTYY